MNMLQPHQDADHRVLIARKRRERMRQRIIDAALRVFARSEGATPAIQDVSREAKISRAAFYDHFDSLQAAFDAASAEVNDRMIVDVLPVYDFLKEPWQRFSVGFRSFLVRAWRDPDWGRFMIHMHAWPQGSLVAHYMRDDVQRGRDAGVFHVDDLTVITNFLMGAKAGCIQALRCGVDDPDAYIDAALSTALQALGCDAATRERALAFSRRHLAEWAAGERCWAAPGEEPRSS
jgi:AcrR family transcriptional regulator